MTQLSVLRTAEFDRVSLIPRRTSITDVSEELSALLRTEHGTQTLRPIQAQGLVEAYENDGLFFPIRVGGGKTLLIFLLVLALRLRRPLIIVPAHLIEKTIRAWKVLSQHWRIPGFIFIRSYQVLSRKGGDDILNDIRPDGILMDEAHRVKNKRAAVTRKISRYMSSYPETKAAAGSGTVTKRSLHDFAHILSWCLKGRTPMPFTWNELEAWASAIDERPNAQQRYHPGVLLSWSDDRDTGDQYDRARQAYRRRMVETAGVVASPEGKIDAEISITGHVVQGNPGPWHRLRSHREKPGSDEPLVDGVAMWGAARQFSCGFYYEQDPPPPKPWKEARKAWHSFVRHVIGGNRRNLDSEFQVAQACHQHPEWYGDEEWKAWREIKDSYDPEKHKKPVWFDDTILKWCAAWLQEHRGLVWCEHIAFAEALSYMTGIPYFGQKGMCGKLYIEDYKGPAILSINANKEGRNLQHDWHRMLIVGPIPSGADTEQVLGRVYREGQEEDEVFVDILFSCFEHYANWEQSVRDASYLQHTQGEQILSIADITIPNAPTQGPQWVK